MRAGPEMLRSIDSPESTFVTATKSLPVIWIRPSWKNVTYSLFAVTSIKTGNEQLFGRSKPSEKRGSRAGWPALAAPAASTVTSTAARAATVRLPMFMGQVPFPAVVPQTPPSATACLPAQRATVFLRYRDNCVKVGLDAVREALG